MVFREELKNVKKYIPGKPISEVKAEYNLEDIIKLASNENPLGTSPLALKEMREALEGVNIYPDGAQAAAKKAIAEYWGIREDMIMIGNGGEECVKLLAQAIIDKGDELIMPWPSFSLYEIAASIMGGKVIKSELDENFEPDVDDIISHLSDKTKMVVVCSPNNPTGNIIPKDRLAKLVDALSDDVVLVLDEAYYEFAAINPDYEDALSILSKRSNTVILRTFSKVCGMAGIRAGYIISSPEFIDNMSKVRSVFNSGLIAQAGIVGATKDVDFIEKTVELNYKSLSIMEECFDRLGLTYAKSNSNFIWVNIGRSSKVVNEELLKRGVIIRPGFLWGYDEYLRVSTGTIEQTERFVEAFEEVMNG